MTAHEHVDEVAPALVSTIEVARPPDEAFAAYTQRFGDWWDPRLTPDPASFTGAVIEPRVGGMVALLHGEETFPFGEVLVWQPGRQLRHTFTLSLDRAFPTLLTVDFAATTSGTVVTLTHGGWVEGNVAERRKFGEWQRLLERYVALTTT